MYQHIAIEGVIGAGKTTFAKYISECLSCRILLEEFEDNPFLAKFYLDKEKFGFPLELAFLASRYHQIKQVLEQRNLFDDKICSDFVLYKSLVFASINLQGDELELYRKLFNIMFQQIPIPDITIYIYHTTEQLLRNIAHRGREYEKNISSDYLEKLNETYLQYFKQLSHHRIIIIDGKQFEIINNPSHQKRLIEILHQEYPLGISYI